MGGFEGVRNPKISQIIVRMLFDYQDNKLIWKEQTHYSNWSGKEAGSKQPTGYYIVCWNGRRYKRADLVWIWHGRDIPEGYFLDHRDLDRANDEIDNLRLASFSENNCNLPLRKDNKSGVKGVTWNKRKYCWCGRITKDGKVYQKYSKEKEDVVAFVNKLRKELHGEFANDG